MVKYIESREEWNGLMEKSKTQLVVVDFTASWCPPCRYIAPIFENLAGRNPNAKFVKVDVDAQEEIAGMNIQFFKGGQKVAELHGGTKPL